MRKKQFSYFSFQNFFGFWAKNFSDFWPKNVKNLSKLPSTCPEEQFVAWIFKFWIVSDFLQKPLAWFSKFYLRVQIENCGEKLFFFVFFPDFFRFLSVKFFRFLAKSSKSCENYLLRVHRNNLWLQNFLKSFEPFWIFCRNLWLGSQISIYMSRVKIAEQIVFLFFFSDFFRILSENFFRLSAKKLQKVVKTTFYVSRGTVCGLKFFSKNLDFLHKPSACFSKFYLRVQSENCGRNSCFIFLFRFFSDFERKFFQTFGEKTSKSCQNYLLRVQRNSLWLEIFF